MCQGVYEFSKILSSEKVKELQNRMDAVDTGWEISESCATLDYQEMSESDIEKQLDLLSEFAKENSVNVTGTIDGTENFDGEEHHYRMNKTEWKDLSDDEYAFAEASDETLTGELESRGYIVTKKTA